jgi:hypothetical protein
MPVEMPPNPLLSGVLFESKRLACLERVVVIDDGLHLFNIVYRRVGPLSYLPRDIATNCIVTLIEGSPQVRRHCVLLATLVQWMAG